jgi:FixJ family two-component response regulator
MRKLKLLQRLVAALARNEGVQSKRTEILQRLESLSPREVDVLCYVLGGQLNREIAAELGVSERTIKAHRGRVMKKLGVRSMLNYSQWCGVCYGRVDSTYFTSHGAKFVDRI